MWMIVGCFVPAAVTICVYVELIHYFDALRYVRGHQSSVFREFGCPITPTSLEFFLFLGIKTLARVY